jgi:hypothetical protein
VDSRSFGDHTGSAGSDAEGEGRWDLSDDWICGKAGCNRQPPFVPLFTEQRQSAFLVNQLCRTLYNVAPSAPPSLQSSAPALPPILTMSYSPIHKASLVESSTHSPDLLELVDLKLSRPIIGKSHSLFLFLCIPKTLSQNILSIPSSRLSTMLSTAPHPQIPGGADLSRGIPRAQLSVPWSTMSSRGPK